MRIADGDNPLDATGVHPESYEATERFCAKFGSSVSEFIGEKASSFKCSDWKKLSAELGIGEITLKDIVKELGKPGRDPQHAI